MALLFQNHCPSTSQTRSRRIRHNKRHQRPVSPAYSSDSNYACVWALTPPHPYLPNATHSHNAMCRTGKGV